MSHRIRKAFLFAHLIAFLLAPALTAHAKGKGFKDVVKHLETNYRAKKTKIPLLGLANFAVKIIRPAGVKGFKLAVFEDQDFLARPELAASFGSVMRDAYNKDWMPLVQLNSKRSGNSRVYIYAKYSGKDVEFALTSFEEREAVVLQVKFNPDAAARFLENPKIMGISLGGPIRGNGGPSSTIATRSVRRGPGAGGGNRTTSGDRTIAEMDAPDTGEPKPPPVLKTADNDKNNPSVPAVPAVPAAASATTGSAPTASKDGTVAARPTASSASAAPTDPKTAVPAVDTIRIETRLVNLNVKAMDRAGQPITNLKLEDFVVYEDGVKQSVEHFKPVNAPVNVVLLMDLSGSTKKRRRAMADAAKRFVDALPAQDKISVVAFTRRYRALTGFTKDKDTLKNAIEQINGIDGGTAFYDSLWKALDDLDRVPDARKAVVVMTDGEDESLIGNQETDHAFDDLLGRASEEDVTIYPIYFKASDSINHYSKLGSIFGGGGLRISDHAQTARKQLDELAEATGGEVVNAQREEDLEAAYQRVAQELHMLYSLGYLPDKMKHDGSFRKISVKLAREDAVAKTRKGYFDK
jgi:VWFA-related protein